METFYHLFIKADPEIQQLFEHTGMDALKRKLGSTLRICVNSAEEEGGGKLYLEHLGRVHHRLDIKPEQYDTWLQSLLISVKRCDPEFDQKIETAWRNVMSRSIEVLLSQYSECPAASN